MIAPVDVTNVRIETDRLILRGWRESDLEDFFEYASVDGVGQLCGWMPHKDIEESRRILAVFIDEKKTLAVELKENSKVIGSIGLESRDADLGIPERLMGREIGYVLNKDYWGRGLMPEAVKAVIDYCFDVLDFDWLTCGHFLWNDQSRRVVEKCDFRFIKEVVHQTRFDTEELTKLYVLENKGKIVRQMSASIEPENIYIETERLVLRPLKYADLPDIHVICGDAEVAKKAGFSHCATLEESEKRLEEYIGDKETLGVARKDNGKIIGTISLQKRPWYLYPIDRNMKGREYGFDLGKAYWGQGYMPEAVKAVTDYCFETLNYDFLTAGHFQGNTQSQRAIEKCGFQFLFEDDRQLDNKETVHICTYIQYNPRKDI